jgi:hypothetical protein
MALSGVCVVNAKMTGLLNAVGMRLHGRMVMPTFKTLDSQEVPRGCLYAVFLFVGKIENGLLKNPNFIRNTSDGSTESD